MEFKVDGLHDVLWLFMCSTRRVKMFKLESK